MPVRLFSKHIHSNFTLKMALKNTEMTIAAMNYFRQYQLNFSIIEESKITSLYRADNSLDLNNTKKIVFYSPIDSYQS